MSSHARRDRVNTGTCDAKSMPFGVRRMSYDGVEVMVDAGWQRAHTTALNSEVCHGRHHSSRGNQSES
jgi:hypothetical protein